MRNISPLSLLPAVSLLLLPAAGTLNAASSSRLSDEPLPMQLEGFPERPAPIVELGQNPFLGNGYIGPGYQIPTGAVWQPLFIVYGTMRSAVQTFDSGDSGGEVTEWANRLDLFGNLYLTPTERILIGFRPLDEDGVFSGYRFSDPESEVNGFNGELTTFFMEGDFGELFPFLDPYDRKSIDYGFSVGRQPLSFQNGILINDTVDAIGITRSSLFLFGASAFRATFIFGWSEVNRGNHVEDKDAILYGLHLAADYDRTSVEIDTIYTEGSDTGGGDQWNGGISMIQRIGYVNTTFSANVSVGLDDEFEGDAADDGVLLLGQFSLTPPHSDDLVYANVFWGIDSFRSAARGPATGGPLGEVGILFAAVGLGNYGAPLGNTPDDSVGGALGYQHFFHGTRGQIAFEAGARTATQGPSDDEFALGARFQHAFGRHLIFRADAHVSEADDRDTGYGLRTELVLKF